MEDSPSNGSLFFNERIDDRKTIPSIPEEDKPSLSQNKPEEPDRQSKTDSVASDNNEPHGPSLDLSSIITETSDILEKYRNFLSVRKTKQAMASYYLLKLSSTLEDYFKFQKKLDNFFSQHAVVTAEIYLKHYSSLPAYGDYTKIIKDTPKLIKVSNIPSAIPEADIRTIVIRVIDNVFAGGSYTKSQYQSCQNITSLVAERKGTFNKVKNTFPFWIQLLEKEASNNQNQSDSMFEILSFIHFLSTGINEETLSLILPKYGDYPAD